LFFGEFGGGLALVVIEDEIDLEFGVEAEAGIERLVELGFEPGERADKFGGDQFDGFRLR